MEKKARPLCLVIKSTKDEITQCLNNAVANGLPCCILSMILGEALSQVRNVERQEIEAARESEKDLTKDTEKGKKENE